ncbi:MAG TPA: hypothetical protein VH352_19020, partial [Pseudonocardiaceae bacterium]|nr:hypothetical protein [Pseudonocardiaceae bacterium]
MTRRTRAVLAAGLLVTLFAAPPALGALQVTGRTEFRLASAGSDGVPAGADSGQPALSANGTYTAFASPATLNVGASVPQSASAGSFQPTKVYARGRLAGTTTLLSDAAGVDADAPSMSGDGRLVAYDAVGIFSGTKQIDVVNRQATGRGAFDTSANLAVSTVTGNAGDPHYQRITACSFFNESGTRGGCGPQLSADGGTLAYPAQLSPVVPNLSVSTGEGVSGNVVDFVPFGTMTLGGASAGTFTVTLRYSNFSNTPIQLIGPPVVTGPFQLTGFTCNPPTSDVAPSVQAIVPGQPCTATIVFDASQSCPGNGQTVVRTGDIVTDATTADGQSDTELVATCSANQQTSSFPTTTQTPPPPPACAPEPAGLSAAPAPFGDGDNQGTQLVDFGQAEVGRPVLEWVPVSGIGQVSFQANDCSVQFVGAPAVPQAGLPPACHPGQELGTVDDSGHQVASSCTGYFLVTPQDVNTRAALLTVGGSGNVQATYLAVTGVRSVVVARHGPNFAASQGTVISVDGNGNPIPGAGAPSLSANGRFVAFTALDQVWRHDRDRAGDGSGLPGATNVASCLPGPGCQLPVSAGSPSISGDGSSIAFATPPTGSTQGQVYVRRTTTVLVSAGGNGASQAPVRSQDGSTLAFTSF